MSIINPYSYEISEEQQEKAESFTTTYKRDKHILSMLIVQNGQMTYGEWQGICSTYKRSEFPLRLGMRFDDDIINRLQYYATRGEYHVTCYSYEQTLIAGPRDKHFYYDVNGIYQNYIYGPLSNTTFWNTAAGITGLTGAAGITGNVSIMGGGGGAGAWSGVVSAGGSMSLPAGTVITTTGNITTGSWYPSTPYSITSAGSVGINSPTSGTALPVYPSTASSASVPTITTTLPTAANVTYTPSKEPNKKSWLDKIDDWFDKMWGV